MSARFVRAPVGVRRRWNTAAVDDRDQQTKRADKIRGLLAKANNDGATPAEAESYTEAALRLMAKWNIAHRDLREHSVIEERSLDFTMFGRAQYGVARLAVMVARVFGCTGLRRELGDGNVGRVVLFGRAAALDDAEMLIHHLVPQLMRDVARDKPRSRKSYAVAWADRVAGRLVELQEVVYSESNALVPTTTDADRAMTERYSVVASPRFRADSASFHQGRAAGTDADLDQVRLDAAG